MVHQLPRITYVDPGAGARLAVVWDDGTNDDVCLAGWIGRGGDLLKPLDEPEIFGTAQIGDYGTSIYWGDEDGDLAIDAHNLRQIAEAQRPFGRAELVAWQNATGFSNQEAASFLGVALSTWNAYKTGASIPVQIAMLCRATARDRVLLHAYFRPRTPGRPRKAMRA